MLFLFLYFIIYGKIFNHELNVLSAIACQRENILESYLRLLTCVIIKLLYFLLWNDRLPDS